MTEKNIFTINLCCFDPDEKKLVDPAIDAYKQGLIVKFSEKIYQRQWEYFCAMTHKISGTVKLWSPLPSTWLRNADMQVEVFNDHVFKVAKQFCQLKKQIKIDYHRKANHLKYPFILPYGSFQHEREVLMQALERLKILDGSLYSRPPQLLDLQNTINFNYLFPITKLALPKTIEQDKDTIDYNQRYCHDTNIFNLLDLAKQAHCYVIVDNLCLNDQSCGGVTEKVLYPILCGIPFIYIGSREQRLTLSRWGIQPNDTMRDDVRGVCEQMQWLKSIFSDSTLAQQWQDCQGKTIISNFNALKNLPELLLKGK